MLLVESFRMGHKSSPHHALLVSYGMSSIIIVAMFDVIVDGIITPVSNDRVNSK